MNLTKGFRMQCADLCLCGGNGGRTRRKKTERKITWRFMCLDIYSIQPCVSKNWNNIHKTKDLETLTGGKKTQTLNLKES